MNTRTLTYLGIFSLLIGAALCVSYQVITTQGVTIAAGIMFLVVGFANLLFPVRKAQGQPVQGVARFFSLMSDVAAIVLGASLLRYSLTFAKIIAFIFGLVVAFASLWQFVFVISYGKSQWRLPAWVYIFPVAIAAGAVYIFIQDVTTDHLIMLATGISLIVLGVGCIVENILLGVKRRRYPDVAPAAEERRSHENSTADADAAETSTETPAQPRIEAQAQHPARIETTDDLDDEIVR